MFSGIVMPAQLVSVTNYGDGVCLKVHAENLSDKYFIQGSSIAVNGVCLTVAGFDLERKELSFIASAHTLSCTSGLDSKGLVNIETSLAYSDLMSGHLVLGHVDAVAQIVSFEAVAESWRLRIRVPSNLLPYIAVKGSVAVDGVSLTVNAIDQDVFEVNIIPHTMKMTNMPEYCDGRLVNIEIDVLARYLQRQIECRLQDLSLKS